MSTHNLSRREVKALKVISHKGAISDQYVLNEEEPYIYLYRIKLIERFYSENFPTPDVEDFMLPLNALRITDAGRAALAEVQTDIHRWRWQLIVDVLTLGISIAAFIKSFFF